MLDAFPNSAYYFDARFLLCKAFRNAAPPDLDGAIEQIRDIMDYASSDPVLQFKAMIEYSDILANKGGADNLQTAVGRLEGVLLYDPSLPGVKEYYEQALYGVATLYARLGNAAKRDEKVRLYKEKFPAGKFAAAMNQLPAADPGIAVAPQAASPAPQLPAAAPKR
jgi:hypothetical protein